MKFLVRIAAIALVAWAALFGISQIVRISPVLPLWAAGFAIALAAEALLRLFRYEAGAVTQRRARWIAGLRMFALAVLVWILIEPVWVRKAEREIRREVVVILDDSGSMQLIDEGAAATRIALGEAALRESRLVETLEKSLRVRVVRAARSVRAEGGEAAAGWADSTDLAAALGTVLEQVPPDELAGVVLISDGRHNRPDRVEDVARRFGILDAPVGLVPIGSAEPPRDAAVLAVRAPDAIHIGDRMRVAADLKFDGLRGQTAKISLKRGGEVVEEREIPIPQDRHREEIRFAFVPEQGGVNDYRVEIAPLPGERFPDNNGWDFETSITSARTNVLLVESFPRWEFRYLRNLFYGRDKSVHLQYVLLDPDRVSGQESPVIPASAARPFGEAQATRMPENEEEWRKFDVIILGDIDPAALDAGQWEILSRCVNDRGALLAMIAGPRSMPHGISSPAGRALVPVEMDFGRQNHFQSAGAPFHFHLTSEGAAHPVTQQGDGTAGSARAWAGFPEIRWRHPVASLKQGAEVLLTASDAGEIAAPETGAGLATALDDLTERRQREAAAALLVTRQTGRGKVALLLTDRTWRLREGAGDLYHHRFWGNLVRWGAGPVLRSGGRRAQLGTDQLTYTPDDRPRITARLRDTSLAPVDDATLRAEVRSGGKILATVPMRPVKDSSGLYEADFPAFASAGGYQVRLLGDKIGALVQEDGGADLAADFRVVGSRGPVELAETTLNRPLLETIATLSGGKIVTPEAIADLAPLFLTEKNRRSELRESSLWDNAWVLGLLCLALGAEWVVRRGGGLP